MSSASLCWTCQQPQHDGPCPPPNPFDEARRQAEANLRYEAERLRLELKPFLGFHLSGHLNGTWVVRTPKGKELKAETPAALLDLVRKASGKAPSAPVQEGFGW